MQKPSDRRRMLRNRAPQQLTDQFQCSWSGVFDNEWFGIPTLQNPLDVWITQEIMTETVPDVIIEAGCRSGGSAILWAMILENINADAHVITIDVRDVRHPRAKSHRLARDRVTFLLGSSTDAAVVSEVERRTRGKRVLPILDSLHTCDHVLGELRAYAPMVGVGGYVIVQDTAINGHPVAPEFGPGPWEAVEAFLAETSAFEVDPSRERFGLTNCRNGFLKRVR